jgi:hypothetical protein
MVVRTTKVVDVQLTKKEIEGILIAHCLKRLGYYDKLSSVDVQEWSITPDGSFTISIVDPQ